MKWQYKVKNMPEKRLLRAIVDGAVWEKITEGRAGIRWDNVVEKYERFRGRPRKKRRSTWRYTGG